MALTDKLSAIGNAIRAKTGGTELLTLDAMPNEIAVESIFLKPIVSINVRSPIFFVTSTNFKPNFAITLFSSTNGTMSEIVPTQTKSKYFKYSFSSNPNLIEIA